MGSLSLVGSCQEILMRWSASIIGHRWNKACLRMILDEQWTIRLRITYSATALNMWLGASHHRDIRLALHRAGTMWHLPWGKPWEAESTESFRDEFDWGETSSNVHKNSRKMWKRKSTEFANMLPTSFRWTQRVMYSSSSSFGFSLMLSRAVHLLRSLTWHLSHANASDEDNRCLIDNAYLQPGTSIDRWLLLLGWFQIMGKNLFH